MSFSTIRYTLASHGVATITLNQPDTRNALSDEVLAELIAAFTIVRDDDNARCVVLTSSHEKVFSAGGNLAGFGGEQQLIEKHFGIEKFPRLFELIGQLGKPSLCAANGHVLAGALGLALACDLVIAKQGVRFGTPEINVGVFPFMIAALIYRNIGRKKATELLLLGEQIEAAEALQIGLINKVVPSSEFENTVAEYAQKLATKSPLLMRLGKDALFRSQDMAFSDALEFLRCNLTVAFATEDLHEGVKAFFEKRQPVWSGR